MLLAAWPVLAYCLAPVAAKVVPFLTPGFLFDYDIDGAPVPVPVSQQCEVLHLKWGRRDQTGPSPVAPYSLQIFTSTFITPFLIDAGSALTFDWAVPFTPGTQYQICMWDSNGVPGGCQDKYTVVPNLSGDEDALNCPNVTFPDTALNVTAMDTTGPLSQFGFPNQCSDISVKPNAGTPPFTLTIAPPLHPPFNLTSNTMDPIVWTLSLSRAMPFFMSLVSSEGLVWSFGPIHSGGPGLADCLAPGTVNIKTAKKSTVGAGVGGVFGGLAFGLLLAMGWTLFQRRRKVKPTFPYAFEGKLDNNIQSVTVPTLQIGAPIGLGSPSYDSSDGYSTSPNSDISTSIGRQRSVNTTAGSGIETPRRSLSNGQSQQVFVIHRDGGRAPPPPVTVYEEDIVELPPHYVDRGERRTRTSGTRTQGSVANSESSDVTAATANTSWSTRSRALPTPSSRPIPPVPSPVPEKIPIPSNPRPSSGSSTSGAGLRF